MNQKIIVSNDWTRNWQASIAVKITAIALWVIIIVVFIVAYYLLDDLEAQVRENQIDTSIKITYQASMLWPTTAHLSFDQKLEKLHQEYTKLNLTGIELSRNGETYAIGNFNKEASSIEHKIRSADSENELINVRTYFPDPQIEANALRKKVLAIIFLSLLLFGLFLTMAIRIILDKPLQILVNATRSIYEGDEELRLDTSREDEFGTLSRFFNKMLDRLMEQKNLKNAAKSAELSNKIKSGFLANMSHEIRTPMNAIIGMNQLVLKTELTDKQRSYLLKVDNASKLLLNIINDILDFSKIEADKLEIESVKFNLESVLLDLSDMMSQKANEKNLELLFHISSNIPATLVGDPFRLEQVLINLISNALKFTEEGEVILTIKVLEKTGDEVKLYITVVDSGVGMEPDVARTIFTPFTQADASTTRKYGGTGLGLSISQRLVNLMGGHIQIDSIPGTGTVVGFDIPFKFIKPVEHKLSSVEYELPNDLIGCSVLVADDNQSSLAILNYDFTALGLNCTTVSSGEEALDKIEKTHFDLVVLDYQMQGLNGIETAQRIRKNESTKHLPIIIVTAHSNADVLSQARSAEIGSVLEKPVHSASLLDAIMIVFGYKQSDHFPKVSKFLEENQNRSVEGINVLLVEDIKVNQEVAQEILEAGGVTVKIVDNGDDALKILKDPENGIDAVLMDIQMPNKNGYETTKLIREIEHCRDLPIIAMTAHAMHGDRELCLKAGMNDYLSKPIDESTLFSKLAQWSRAENTHRKDRKSAHSPDSKAQKSDSDFLPDSLPGISLAEGLKRLNNKCTFYVSLLNTLDKDCPSFISKLKNAVSKNDMKQAQNICHTLKGYAANLSAQGICQTATALETAIKKNKHDTILTSLKNLEVETTTFQKSMAIINSSFIESD